MICAEIMMVVFQDETGRFGSLKPRSDKWKLIAKDIQDKRSVEALASLG